MLNLPQGQRFQADVFPQSIKVQTVAVIVEVFWSGSYYGKQFENSAESRTSVLALCSAARPPRYICAF